MNENNGKKIIAIIIIIVLLTLIMTRCHSNSMPAYIEETSTEVTTEINLDSYIIEDKNNNFTLKIPSEFTKTVKNNGYMFVNSVSESYIKLEIYDYNPQINWYSKEQLDSDLKNKHDIKKFENVSSSVKKMVYNEVMENGVNYYTTKYYIWDRTKIMEVNIGINEEYKKDQNKIADFVYNNINWQQTDAINKDYMIYYSEFGNFEFAVPITWKYSINNGALVAYDESLGINMSANVAKYTSDFSALTQLNYASSVSSSRSNFVLSSFNVSASKVIAEATYTSSGVKMYMSQLLICNGAYEYVFTFDMPYQNLNDTTMNILNTVISYFRNI